jgi:predicted membrane channel-forming protein YqfA (hemolysin III family)
MKFLMNKKLIGSTIVLMIGVLTMISALIYPSPTAVTADSFPGLFMILGALAYRSAKKRKLKPIENTRKRRMLEFLALALMAVIILLDPDILQRTHDGAITNLIILVWAIVAYLFAVPKGMAEQKKV